MKNSIVSELRPALVVFALLAVLTGLVYPALITVLAHTLFAHEAAGSPIERDGQLLGSSLIGQAFSNPKHFWSRPSATTPQPYNGGASSASNLGPLNPALTDAVRERIAALRAADPGNSAPVPVDLVTASASGLDPDISVAAARYQVGRIARARGLAPETLEQLIRTHSRGRWLGFLGEPRVNVLELNLALDPLR
jgi:potassium-transporting ATPase KdpC subunit